ncbi:ABC transporter ATP-binding protein [Thermosulfuriphilus sp.]
MRATLTFEKATLGYRGEKVIEDLDLSFAPGQWTSLIGPNGAGKTTIIQSAAGLLPPLNGRIRLSGRDISEFSPRQRARHIALVRQGQEVLYPFSCLEMVIFGRYPHKSSYQKDLEVALQALATTNVLHLASRPITAVSGGERQRVFVARALAQEAEIILLDEPAAHLDPSQTQALFTHLRRIREEGKTIVCALHDLNAASVYSDQVVLLKRGKIIAQGPPEEVLNAKTLKLTFEIDFKVLCLPGSKRPLIIPLPS